MLSQFYFNPNPQLRAWMVCAEHVYNFGYEWYIIISLLEAKEQWDPGAPQFEGSDCCVDVWWDFLEEGCVRPRVQTYTGQHKNGKGANMKTRQKLNSNA